MRRRLYAGARKYRPWGRIGQPPISTSSSLRCSGSIAQEHQQALQTTGPKSAARSAGALARHRQARSCRRWPICATSGVTTTPPLRSSTTPARALATSAAVKRYTALPNHRRGVTRIFRRNGQELQLSIEHGAAQGAGLLLGLKTNPPTLALEALDSPPAASSASNTFLPRPQRHLRKTRV